MTKQETGQVHTPTFGKVMKSLLHDLSITDGAKVLYAHMHWRYGQNQQNFEGQKSMASMLGVSEKTIKNRIDELEANDWIVTIYHEHDKKGNWQRSHYHIFETQDECRQFRAEYKKAEGETLKEKPEGRERKSRKGKGNPNPKLPPRENSVSDGRQNLSSDGRQKPSSDGRQNLSSEYTDSLNPDSSIQTHKDMSPSGDRPRNLIFDTIHKHSFHDAPLTKSDQVLCGMAAAWFAGKPPNKRNAARGIDQLQIPATPSELEKFYSWYKVNPDTEKAHPPIDLLKFQKHFRAFRELYPPAAPAKEPEHYIAMDDERLKRIEELQRKAIEKVGA